MVRYASTATGSPPIGGTVRFDTARQDNSRSASASSAHRASEPETPTARPPTPSIASITREPFSARPPSTRLTDRSPARAA
jgi:hypothetical protein